MEFFKLEKSLKGELLPVECEKCAYRYASKGCAAEHIDAVPGHASPEQCKGCRAMVKNGFTKTV